MVKAWVWSPVKGWMEITPSYFMGPGLLNPVWCSSSSVRLVFTTNGKPPAWRSDIQGQP